jgi:hypothetical protein
MYSHRRNPQWTNPSASLEDRVTGTTPMEGLLIGNGRKPNFDNDTAMQQNAGVVMMSTTNLLPFRACTTFQFGHSHANIMELLHEAA